MEKQKTASVEIKAGSRFLGLYDIEAGPIKGDMGSMYMAHHSDWNMDLAIILPYAHKFRTTARKNAFIRECVTWINLGLHPNIVSCYYIRNIGGIPVIFSEWMDEGSLKDWIENKKLYEGTKEEIKERIFDIAIQYARGLKYLHEKGLVCRDLKPENLLMNSEGKAKILAFGRTKAIKFSTKNRKNLTAKSDIGNWAAAVLGMYGIEYNTKLDGIDAGIVLNEYFKKSEVKPVRR